MDIRLWLDKFKSGIGVEVGIGIRFFFGFGWRGGKEGEV